MDFLPSGAKRERYRAPEAICSNYKNSLAVAKKVGEGVSQEISREEAFSAKV